MPGLGSLGAVRERVLLSGRAPPPGQRRRAPGRPPSRRPRSGCRRRCSTSAAGRVPPRTDRRSAPTSGSTRRGVNTPASSSRRAETASLLRLARTMPNWSTVADLAIRSSGGDPIGHDARNRALKAQCGRWRSRCPGSRRACDVVSGAGAAVACAPIASRRTTAIAARCRDQCGSWHLPGSASGSKLLPGRGRMQTGADQPFGGRGGVPVARSTSSRARYSFSSMSPRA